MQLALLVSSQLWGQTFALAPDVSRASQATRRLLNVLDLGSFKELSSALMPVGDIEATPEPSEKAQPIDGGVTVALKHVIFSYPARPETTAWT